MESYLWKITEKFKDPQTSEMGYRTDFENFLEQIFPKEQKYYIHHDARAIGGNKPDFIVLRNQVPVLYIEAKDIGTDLDKVEKSSQMERYYGYENLILTDYIEFRFFRNGEKYGESIKLASCNKNNRTLRPLPATSLEKTLVDFTLSHKEPIKRGKHLAQIMGGKAQRIRNNVCEMLTSGSDTWLELLKIRDVMRDNLVAHLDDESFADMYAQTLVYGLFAARYNDKSPENFSRQEARELVPNTNPFLGSFFDHITGNSFPERLRFVVDELCDVFSHADVQKILHDFYAIEKDSKDPIIHFYEDFLREYDAQKKMEMGVFYTPRPVVQFIVRAVDEILKKEFGLLKGLADTTKIKQKVSAHYTDARFKDGIRKKEAEVHRVQVLDVATGTGTFLNEVIGHIQKSFVNQEGRWDAYVKNDLLPRLHGFELMMASYTIAHLKVGMTFRESGVENLNQRVGIYLTNTLEEPKSSQWGEGSLFVGLQSAITDEALRASEIKRDYPIMCVIGNPPYSGESMNPEYTDNDVYKVEPGGKLKLNERNPKWINDDYVKFIRFAESLIEKNGEGIVGMITAHGYVDNPTFRGMRWHLRKTFDKIYVIDLHGNSRKKEMAPDGSKDENVFDIMTGVAIILGVKNKTKNDDQLATVYKLDLYGTRKSKFAFLDEKDVENISWQELPYETELWVLEGDGKKEYQRGFSLVEMFPLNSVGIVTGRDRLAIQYTENEMWDTLNVFGSLSPEEARSKYGLGKDSKEWAIEDAQQYIMNGGLDREKVTKIAYRPFDTRWIYYPGNSKGFQCIVRARTKLNKHIFKKDNLCIGFSRTVVGNYDWNDIQIFNTIVEFGYMATRVGNGAPLAPLYLYADDGGKVPNLNKDIWSKINDAIGETTPENILDYIYASLHSPSYREKYEEFLKKDFPRVPYPSDKENFWKFAKIGERLRELHLMIDPEVSNLITTYPIAGSDRIDKVSYRDEKIYINDTQYFGNVPLTAWNFYIGGYQPAQKWLKDRKGRELSNDDIEHYQKIIKVLVETEKLMRKIDQK